MCVFVSPVHFNLSVVRPCASCVQTVLQRAVISRVLVSLAVRATRHQEWAILRAVTVNQAPTQSLKMPSLAVCRALSARKRLQKRLNSVELAMQARMRIAQALQFVTNVTKDTSRFVVVHVPRTWVRRHQFMIVVGDICRVHRVRVSAIHVAPGRTRQNPAIRFALELLLSSSSWDVHAAQLGSFSVCSVLLFRWIVCI